MKCIFCGGQESKVVDSRYLKDSSIRRRRECLTCGKRFTTYETVETSPMVVTNVDNMREPFKLEKLIESLSIACSYKDSVDKVPTMALNIEQLLLNEGKQEITTADIVRVTLKELLDEDKMCALVYYTQHTDCQNFDKVREFINR